MLTTIERDYVDVVSADELVEAAIEGMVTHLDKQSRWLSAAQMQHLQEETDGATVGLGIEVTEDDRGPLITRVLPGSPALRQGLIAGDRILEIDGETVANLALPVLRERLGGARGESAILTIIREGWDEARQVETVRDRVHLASVSGHLFDHVAYIRLVQFQHGSGFEVEETIRELGKLAGGIGKLDGVIIDVRDNPGGLLTEAVIVTDLFFVDGPIVSTEGRKDEPEVHRATSGGIAEDLDVAILVNGYSASASEILAGAIQDTQRGVVIGSQTWGKGTVQQVYKHAGQTALKLTVGRYYTPSGAPVADREGRIPDIVVAYPTQKTALDELTSALGKAHLSDEERAELLTLAGALQDTRSEPKPIEWDVPVPKRLHNDPQLQAAIAYLQED
ncbi:MAG: PDZ domain-containing protein [Rhodobacterales bacterium]|nr:PDZ domain-containing protein [Rhodobacterales bacterium]